MKKKVYQVKNQNKKIGMQYTAMKNRKTMITIKMI